MEDEAAALSNALIVGTILENLAVPDLISCAGLNSLWNREAVKILNKKAIIKLTFDGHVSFRRTIDDKKLSSYLQMVGEGGGRCHDQIAIDAWGTDLDDTYHETRQKVTNEEFQTLLAAVAAFGAKVKELKVKLEFGEGRPTPQDYQPIFISTPNVESLSIEFQYAGETSELCFPPKIPNFNSLKQFCFCTMSSSLLGSKWTEQSIKSVVSKFITNAPNIQEVSRSEFENAVEIILEEIGAFPGRLEKITVLDVDPNERTTNLLLERDFSNLKCLKVALRTEDCARVQKILERVKDTLEVFNVSLNYNQVATMRFPKSMESLKELGVRFVCSYFQDQCEYAKYYPVLQFQSSDDNDAAFYPKLNKIVIGGNRRSNVLVKYLRIIFPGERRGRRSFTPAFKFPSVYNLDITSPFENWEKICALEGDRLIRYFPNADFKGIVATPDDSEEDEGSQNSEDFGDQFYDYDDSD